MSRLLLFILLFVFSFASYAEPAYLAGIRIKPSVNATSIQFILSKKTFGRVRALHHPERITVEFTNTQKNFSIQKAKLLNTNIQSFSANELANDKVEFVFYVKSPASWKTQFIPGQNGKVILELTIISNKPIIKPVTKKISLAVNDDSIFLKDKLEQDIFSAIEEAKLAQKKSVEISMPVKQLQQVKTIFSVNKPQIFTIVIDAGHGGKDTGAIAKTGELEKTVVLAIAKKLADKINQRSDMRAILTRKSDHFLSLRERLRLTRKYNADLFIAIHADGYFENASGASVYALSKSGATSEAARWLAKREYYAELSDVELDSLQDKSLMLRSVLIDMAQTSTIKSSLKLGNNMLNALDDISRLHYRHVEQAPFMVLKSPDIPSILVETGFITNPKEAKRLADNEYQDRLAQALFQGINQYIKQSSVH